MLWLWTGRRLSRQLARFATPRDASPQAICRRLAGCRHAEPRSRRGAGGIRHDVGKPPPDARRARSADRAGAADARDGRLAAAAGDPAGASGGCRACWCPVSRTSSTTLSRPSWAASELLERRPGLPADALEEIAFIKAQSARAREIIRNLSRFSRQQTGPPSPVDLQDVVAEVVQLRGTNLNDAQIALEVQIESTRKRVRQFHRARAGRFELRHQRGAGDSSRRVHSKDG